MKKQIWLITNALLVFVFVVLGNISSPAQKVDSKPAGGGTSVFAEELRPFDFSDKYYWSNGVIAGMIQNRPNGADGLSVADVTYDTRHNNVRILATYPAYGRDGETRYWNFYGEFNKDGFTQERAGFEAYEIANTFPIYMFPSQSRNVGDRQAPIIDTLEGYFQKNVLGLGVAMLVQFKDSVSLTQADVSYLEELAKRNGRSADGSPIIRTVGELEQLQRRDLVSITPRDLDGSQSFIVGKVIQFPEYAITSDAFLIYTRDAQENPIASELFFLEIFNCFQQHGRNCYQ